MDYINAFWVGGLICVLVQILIENTKLMPGRIMVILVVTGVFLGSLWHIPVSERLCRGRCNSASAWFWK